MSTPARTKVRLRAEINLRATLECGQVFHWRERSDGAWEGLIGSRHTVVRQDACGLQVVKGDKKHVSGYFALDHDLGSIYAGFPRDATMLAALDFCRGLRIIRQPTWECLATFITSSMKQVAHIRQMSLALRARYGNAAHGTDMHSYPTPESLAAATESGLRACGLGFRAKNLLASARLVASGQADLEAWRALDDAQLADALCTLPGVGRKVANCVMLFAYERLAAFPVDTWVARIMRLHYWRGRGKVAPAVLEKKLAPKFGPHAGYAQQYLFHHARMMQRRGTR